MTDEQSAVATPAPQKVHTNTFSKVPLFILGAVAAMLWVAGSIDHRTAPGTSQGTAPAQTVIGSAATGADAPASSATATENAATETAASGIFSEPQRGAIEAIVKNYLLKNPDLMLEVQQALDQKMEQQRTEKLAKALGENGKELYRDTAAPVAGNASGDVTVVEFFDYNCGYCRKAIKDVVKLVDTDKNVKVLFKEFPIFGEDSEAAAKVAIAAAKQGKYWEVHKALFENKGKNNLQSALDIAGKLGLDVEKLKVDMAAPDVTAEIERVRALAEKLGVNGTPHFFIGDNVVPGAPENLYDELEKHVSEVRKSGCNVC